MVNQREYRQTIGQFATGVTIIISGGPDDAHAMTANAVMSLSLEPMQLAIAVKKNSKMAQQLREKGSFTVNILSEAQRDLSNYFANAWQEAAPPPFIFIPWEKSARLDGCLSALHCQTALTTDGGDHWLVIGRVTALYRAENGTRPLLFYGGSYQTIEVH